MDQYRTPIDVDNKAIPEATYSMVASLRLILSFTKQENIKIITLNVANVQKMIETGMLRQLYGV